MARAAVVEDDVAEPFDEPVRLGVVRRARAHPGTLLALAVFSVVRIAYWMTGGGYSTAMLAVSWQLLDIHDLVAHPFRSVFYLHIQPPFFNLFVAMVLRWSPLTSAVTFQLFYLACGVVIVIALRALLVELGFSPAAATTGACIVAADPVLLTFENAATYEYPVAMLLVVSGWLCARYVKTHRRSTLTWFIVTLTTVVLTRALLHPLWLVASVALLLFVVRPRITPRLLVAFAIPVVLIGGWMVKNQIVFGDATLSSWFGMNLGRGVIAPLPAHDTQQLVDEGKLSKAAEIPPLSWYGTYAPDFPPCTPKHNDPVLTATLKANHLSNFNNECYLPIYADAQKNAINAIRARPGEYLTERWAPFVMHFVHATAPGPLDQTQNRTVVRLLNTYNAFPIAIPVRIDERGWTHPLFPHTKPYHLHMSLLLVFGCALICVKGVQGSWRVLRGKRTAANTTWAYVGFTVLYVTLVSVATEYGENGRFRVMVDPLLLGVGAAAIVTIGVRVVQWIRASRRAPATDESVLPSAGAS